MFTLVTGIAPTPISTDDAISLAPELHHDAELDAAFTEPHVLQGDIADVIVDVRGSEVCSGTPITGTIYVVTAAHCVLDHDGHVTPITVRRDGTEYAAVAALVDTRYHATPSPEFDGAVLVMDQILPGPSATLGHAMPTQGLVTLAGFQPIDTDGTLLRGTNPHDRPRPTRQAGGYIKVDTAVAGCVERSTSVDITPTRLTIPCGLIPGASGGGLFAERRGELLLIGVTSTVAGDLSSNGLVPIANVRRLLADADVYAHRLTNIGSDAPTTGTTLLS